MVRRRPRVKWIKGGGKHGALGRVSAPCAQASHSGLQISPGNGVGSLERVRRRLDARGGWGHGEGLVGQPDKDEEADEDKSKHEELVKQRVRYHDEVLFHGDERGPFYCMRLLLYYPLHSHTRPIRRTGVCVDTLPCAICPS